MGLRDRGLTVVLGAAALAASAAVAAQAPSPLRPPDKPFPPGTRIEAHDGDMVFLTGDARLRVVRRIDGNVRAIYNAEQHWVVLLVDAIDPVQNAPDGRVDATYNFRDLSGDWPRAGGVDGGGRPAHGRAVSPAAPVRVGGTIRTPRKIVDVAGVWPEAARAANITGVVVLEITVGADGSVTAAKVLRSLPMLDEAAVTAVRQWRYEPTVLNGAAVPVLMTVTVNFR